MRILLIRPPARHGIRSAVPSAVEAENQAYPPASLLTLGTWVNAQSTHTARILDAELDNLDWPEVRARIAADAPDVVGITAFTVQLVDVAHTVQVAREAGVERVVLGGPHVNDFPLRSVGYAGVDAVVRGEGQATLVALLDAWEAGQEPTGIPGLMVSPDDPVPDAATYLGDDLDAYPIVDRTLVDYPRYWDLMAGGTFATLMASRGCPHKCTFCNTPRHRFATMSAGRIVDEIESIIALGIRDIYFLDDTFNIAPGRVHELCDEILSRGLDISWTARFRVRGVDLDLARKMKASGCGRIHLGVEQGTTEGLERFKKGVTLAEVETAFAACRKAGIQTVAYFIVGTPVERTRQDVLETIRYAIRLDPDYVMFNVLTPFPNTVLYEEGLRDGVIDPRPWEGFLSLPDETFTAPLWTEHFTVDELREFLDLAYKRFYGRPSYMLRQLTKLRSPADFKRKAKAGLRLLVG